MKTSIISILMAIAVSTICASAFAQTFVTLAPPLDPVTKKYDEGKSCFNFKRGQLKETVMKDTKRNDWDLGYGFLAIAEEDWFIVHASSRSVIRDLGELRWDNPGTIPVLEPLPPFPKDKPRQITIDSSGDTHEAWAKSATTVARVLLGHMYELHIKDDIDDFYVLVRVEEFEQNKHCTISWLRIPSPEQQETP